MSYKLCSASVSTTISLCDCFENSYNYLTVFKTLGLAYKLLSRCFHNSRQKKDKEMQTAYVFLITIPSRSSMVVPNRHDR